MLLLRTGSQPIRDNDEVFHAMGGMIGACRDRIEEVIGRGNLKWVLLVLFLLLTFWYMRRRHLNSL